MLTRVELVGTALVISLVTFGRHADNVPFNARVVVLQVDPDLHQIVRRIDVPQIHLISNRKSRYSHPLKFRECAR